MLQKCVNSNVISDSNILTAQLCFCTEGNVVWNVSEGLHGQRRLRTTRQCCGLPRMVPHELRIFFQLGGKTWPKRNHFTRSIEVAIS